MWPPEAVWEEPHTRFSYIQNKHSVNKKGNVTTVKIKNAIELIAHVDGQLCYMGSFKSVELTDLSRATFKGLPQGTKSRLLQQLASGKAKKKHDIPSMYASGKLAVIQVHLERVGFNPTMCKYLVKAVETFCWAAEINEARTEETTEHALERSGKDE